MTEQKNINNKNDKNETGEINVFLGFREIKNENAKRAEIESTLEYKEYRRRWAEWPRKQIIPQFPFHLDIGITSHCNLQCPMCVRTIQIKNGTWKIPIQHLDNDYFKKAIDEGIREGLYAINLDNFGEPLLNPNIFELIKYAKSMGIMDIMFHTNATLLSPEKAKSLIDAGLDKLIISFDSPYSEEYEKIRIGAKFEKVIENIKSISTIKKELGLIKPIVRINCIVFPQTSPKEIDDTIKLLSPIVDSVGFIDYDSPDGKCEKDYPKDYCSKFICPQLLTRLTVWEDGMIAPCCMDYERELNLGNIKDTSIKRAWESEKLKCIRKKHFEGKFFEIPACRRCDFAVQGDKETRNQKTDK